MVHGGGTIRDSPFSGIVLLVKYRERVADVADSDAQLEHTPQKGAHDTHLLETKSWCTLLNNWIANSSRSGGDARNPPCDAVKLVLTLPSQLSFKVVPHAD